MSLEQISVFVENKTGKLNEVIKVLAANKLDIRAMTLADTAEFGILRLIADDTIATVDALRAAGCVVSLTQVLAVELKDRPGSLAKVLDALARAEVGIEYMYAFTSPKDDGAYVVMRVQDNDATEKALNEAGIRVASKEQFYS